MSMSFLTLYGVVLLVISVPSLCSAGLLLANQTVTLDLSGRVVDGTTLSCSDIDTINKLVAKLLVHLNALADKKGCEFIAITAGGRQCSGASVDIDVLLTCAGDVSDNIADNVQQQKDAIKCIMDRKSSERFSANGATIIVRLFNNVEQRKKPSPTCSKQCSVVEQGLVILCDCPSIDVLKPSCNVPAVLVQITVVTDLNGTNCDQLTATLHPIIPHLAGPLSYDGLHFQVANNSVTSKISCNNTINGLRLYGLTSLAVDVSNPHCADNSSCIQQFNAKQLNTVKKFFQFILSFLPQMQSMSIERIVTSNMTCDVDTTLLCRNGSQLASNGTCCFPGCNCSSRAPVEIVLGVKFNVSELTARHCSQLDFTEVINTINSQVKVGGILVQQAGGRLQSCGTPAINCTELGGRVSCIVVRVPLILTLAPDVVVNSQDDLKHLIFTTVRGFLAGRISVGSGGNISTTNFTVEIINECSTSPATTSPATTSPAATSPATTSPKPSADPCPAGSYQRDEHCRLCPVNHYTDRPNNRSACSQCPSGTTTNGKGSSSVNQCKGPPCPEGQYSNDGHIPCTLCPVGSYQLLSGQISCTDCPAGFTTTNTGTKSLLDCTKTIVTTAPPVITTCVNVTDNFFTSPNYPSNYNVLEKRTYKLQCPSNLKVMVLIIELFLGSGDSLTVHNAEYQTNVIIPEPKMYSVSSISVVFTSDRRNTARGFKIAYGCYLPSLKSHIRSIAFDCAVRNYLKNRDDVIVKLLKVISGELAITSIGNDPDFAPLVTAFSTGGTPCS